MKSYIKFIKIKYIGIIYKDGITYINAVKRQIVDYYVLKSPPFIVVTGVKVKVQCFRPVWKKLCDQKLSSLVSSVQFNCTEPQDVLDVFPFWGAN